MKNIFNFFRAGKISHTQHGASAAGKGSLIAITPHTRILLENFSCVRHSNSVLLGFSIRNLGEEIGRYGLEIINNFDQDGYEYEYDFSFGKAGFSDGPILYYTLPYDIPVRVFVRFKGVDESTVILSQVKLKGSYEPDKKTLLTYDPSGNILLRNLSIEEL